jgi:hypothetical protein
MFWNIGKYLEITLLQGILQSLTLADWLPR